jgi:nucleotide-binding universal stress UspA family protein
MARLADRRPADMLRETDTLDGDVLDLVLDGMVHYLVDAPEGPVGIVDGWGRDRRGRPTTLRVAQGWFGRRRFEIPIEKLLEIDHDARRILLAPGAAEAEPAGFLQRLTGHRSPHVDDGDDPALPRPGGERPVLCGVADNPNASTVVAVAARLAESLAAPLVVTHVTPSDVPPGVSAAPAGQARLREAQARGAEDLIGELLETVVPNGEVRQVVTAGPPAETLEHLAEREGAQLLVIGSASKGVLGALLKGSVSQHVVRHPPCPILVVPPGPTPRD